MHLNKVSKSASFLCYIFLFCTKSDNDWYFFYINHSIEIFTLQHLHQIILTELVLYRRTSLLADCVPIEENCVQVFIVIQLSKNTTPSEEFQNTSKNHSSWCKHRYPLIYIYVHDCPHMTAHTLMEWCSHLSKNNLKITKWYSEVINRQTTQSL